ncbi:guanylate-binding protein 2-like, partial [Lagopus leucura]|uniref:guanylate-binding protein 2-like n=1 Tax=Lagopus leucura TaxID=30410 RepID=UPI001C67E623
TLKSPSHSGSSGPHKFSSAQSRALLLLALLQSGHRPTVAPRNSLCSHCLLPRPIKSVGLILQKEKIKVQICLRSFFPHHKTFVLERPAANRDLAQLELLQEDQLRPRFRQQEEAFCRHIWKEAPVKVLLNSSPVTGRTLARLVEAYMAAISTGSVLCVESVHTAVTEAENKAAVEAAVAKYQRGMEQDLVLPTASLDALMAVHQDWKKRAIAFFLSQALDGTEQHDQALLMDKLEAAKEEFCRRNEEASQQRCQAVLRELWGDMELRVQRGDYVAPGGIRLFQKDLKCMQEEYKRRPDKGVKEEEVLEKFLRVKGLEMIEMWLEGVDRQCKEVLAEARAATQAVEKQVEEHKQKMMQLTKMWVVKEMLELRVHSLEEQQKETLAEVSAAKKVVEKQLEEQQQQQKVMLAEVAAAKKVVEKQLEEQQQQQKVMLAEVAAAKKVVEKQLEEQQQQQKVMLAEVAAAKKVVEKQLEEQQQQQQVMLAEVTAVMKAVEKQLEERWQQWAQQLQEEQSLVLSQRLEELEVRLQEGGAEVAALQQVELMQEEEQAVPSWRSTLLKFLDKVVVPILIRVVNSVVNNAA